MTTPSRVTVAEAAALVGKSKRTIYNLIDDRALRAEDSSSGKLVDLSELRRVLANRRGPGRPKRTARHTNDAA